MTRREIEDLSLRLSTHLDTLIQVQEATGRVRVIGLPLMQDILEALETLAEEMP